MKAKKHRHGYRIQRDTNTVTWQFHKKYASEMQQHQNIFYMNMCEQGEST